MLVLTRRPNQVIHIHTSDGVIEVHLNECNTNQARLGFVAPAKVKIIREEIDSPEESERYTSKLKKLAPPQSERTPSLFRALFTGGATGRH